MKPGVVLLLLLACVPYGLVISALPGRDDCPGGGGAAATLAVGLNFNTPGVWLALVPIVLPLIIAAYTPALCAAYAKALENEAGPEGFGKRDTFGAEHF